MSDRIIEIADGFWNIRGSFKVGGVLDIGTQTSLARLADGRFVLLDSYALSGEVEARVRALTDGGRAIAAVLNLHPFHTLHVARVHEQLPGATLYGTARHHRVAPGLPWDPLRAEDPALHERFAADFAFSVPQGVDFIPRSEKLHFASVLALHRASRALHVDDTLSYTPLPLVGGLNLHPTLKQVLQRRPGAAADFRAWGDSLVALCAQADHLCTAHARPLPPPPRPGQSIAGQVRAALDKAEGILRRHEARWG